MNMFQPLRFLFQFSHHLNPQYLCVCVIRQWDIWLYVQGLGFCCSDVTLFLQLQKTSCEGRTDIPHMFFSFCDSVCSNCLHPFSCFSHIFHSLPPLTISHLPVSLSDLADNLAMDDFTFQEQLLTPRLATAGAGGAASLAAPLWSSFLVPVLPVTLALLLLRHH